jgi:uncharacterized delta-60 repeat protein
VRTVSVGVVVLLISVGVALADPGAPGTGFGTDGVAYGQFGTSSPQVSSGQTVVTAANGDIYVAGLDESDVVQNEFAVFVARYTPAGVLDRSFGTDGVTVEQLAEDDQGTNLESPEDDTTPIGLALTSGGDVVVATNAFDSSNDPAVAVMELTSAGKLNPAFGTDGVLNQQLSTASSPASAATAVAVESNGDIVITGYEVDFHTSDDYFMAEELNPAGTPVTSFGNSGDGVYEADLSVDSAKRFSEGTGVIVDAKGDLVFSVEAYDANGDDEFGIARLTPSGVPDPSFSTGYAQPVPGASTPFSAPDGIAEQPNGDYVLAGVAAFGTNDDEVAVARFTGNGTLDTSFGGTGTGKSLSEVAGSTDSFANGLAIQANGDAVITGDYTTTGASPTVAGFATRLTANGTLDPSFGTGGTAESQFGAGSTLSTTANGATLTAQGQLLTTGQASTSSGDQTYVSETELDAPPAVSFSASPAAPVAGQPVTFTATATPTAGDTIAAYGWNLGTGDSAFTDASGATVTKTFAAPGTYTVAVQATDDDGFSATSTQTVTVAAPPTATSTTPVSTKALAKLTVAKVTTSAHGVSVKLLCQQAACAGTVALSTLEHRLGTKVLAVTAVARRHTTRRVSLGGARFSLAAGKTATLTLKLNATAKALLRRFGHLPARLTVGDRASAATIVRTLTLRR